MRFAVELVPRVFAPFVRSACGVELDMGQCQFRGVDNGQWSGDNRQRAGWLQACGGQRSPGSL